MVNIYLKYLFSFMLLFVVSCNSTPQSDTILKTFTLSKKYRAWQGVAIDGKNIYVFTDRNETFGLENIISVFTHEGIEVRTYKKLYDKERKQTVFMSFGDGNIIGEYLYITAYNANSNINLPYESQVLVYSIPNIKLVKVFDIGGGVAESVTRYKDHYYITYHDSMVLKEFDLTFKMIETYSLSQVMGGYGGYQGAYWEGDNILIQMHGPNKLDQNPSFGLDRYKFDGNKFIFIKREEPLSYGTGQGVAKSKNYILQNDRPDNAIIVKHIKQTGR